jgi:L-ascorbate oxidase
MLTDAGYLQWDLGSGNGTYDAAANEKKFAGGYVPARRDTTQLYQYLRDGEKNTDLGWRAWRLRVTEKNVGAWMMHCHITPHAVMGMNTVWVFGNAEQIRRRVPQPYVAGYLEFDGNAYGNDSYDPLVPHFFASKG